MAQFVVIERCPSESNSLLTFQDLWKFLNVVEKMGLKQQLEKFLLNFLFLVDWRLKIKSECVLNCFPWWQEPNEECSCVWKKNVSPFLDAQSQQSQTTHQLLWCPWHQTCSSRSQESKNSLWTMMLHNRILSNDSGRGFNWCHLFAVFSLLASLHKGEQWWKARVLQLWLSDIKNSKCNIRDKGELSDNPGCHDMVTAVSFGTNCNNVQWQCFVIGFSMHSWGQSHWF